MSMAAFPFRGGPSARVAVSDPGSNASRSTCGGGGGTRPPAGQILLKKRPANLKFQSVMCSSIFNDSPVNARKAIDKRACRRIVDDAIFPREQQQNGHGDLLRGEAQVNVEPHTLK